MAQVQTIDKEIIGYLPFLSAKEKKAVLTVVKGLAENENDLWDEMPDEIKESVRIGFEESEKGLGTPHEVVMKKYKKWLKK